MNARILALVAVFVAFSTYSVDVLLSHGLTALVASHAVVGWESQVFLDLVLAVLAFNALAIPDAKRRGISYAPYFVATLLVGSIGVLAYLIHREILAARRAPRSAQPA
jgi:hypothetical protein